MRMPSRMWGLALAIGLGVATQGQGAWAATAAPRLGPSERVVQRLYAIWQPYTVRTDADPPLEAIAPLLTKSLYTTLTRAYNPPASAGAIIEWDPFTASQESTVSATVLPARRLKGQDLVPVRLRGPGNWPAHMVQVHVVHAGTAWLVDDVSVDEGIKVPSLKKHLLAALGATKK